MANHGVHLPYPDRKEATVGSCACGWLVTYSWGHHGEAVDEAIDHIEQATETEPFEVGTLKGDRSVLPGRSL